MINAEAIGDQAEKAHTETARPADILRRRGEGVKTMEAKELIRRYNAGKRNFERANLSGANLSGTDLHGANLEGANLEWVNLSGANVTSEQLGKAASLKGAAMPDGTKHE